MSHRTRLSCVAWIVSVILSPAIFAHAQGAAGQGAGLNMAEMKFAPVPNMPTCTAGSVQMGDPATGPSILLAKAAAGCAIPWHWHTPNERLMMVFGQGHLEMKDGKPVTLKAGGFAMMPSRHVHQFRCGPRPCALYVYSDAAYDIHYADGQGTEIPPDQALKAVKETAVKATK